MNEFIQWLEDLSMRDTRVRAILRRSLAFYPGVFVPAYPYVEPFLRGESGDWRRKMFYLVAGLWASHQKDDLGGLPLSIGKACASHQLASGSSSTERRFINLLDADDDQLSHRLRQMLALLNGMAIDFESLLNGLLYWNDDQKRTQNTWARDFYRALNQENFDRFQIVKEIKSENHH